METIEVLSASNLIKFFGNFEVDSLTKADGIIGGFSQSPIEITTHGADINLKVKLY